MSAETDHSTDMTADMEAEMEARADAVAYAHAPSIEAHLYNDYINLETGTDVWAEGQAQMDAWANELQESIEAAAADNTATILDTNFLEMDNEGESSLSTETSTSLASTIEQQMDTQLEGQIRVMSEQEMEEQAAIAEMLDADAADAAAEGEDLNLSLLESSSTTSTSSSSTSDLELQAHMDIHEGLRDAMNTKEGMEMIAELEQERVREEALQRAEQWLQGQDTVALETDTETDTETETEATVDTQADATTKAQTLTEQLQAQEARIWASLSAEQKMHARASMAIDTIIQHTMEIHAMNEAASMILDHLISDGYLHEGMEDSEAAEDESGNGTDVEETKVEETRPRPVTLKSCSLSASNHLRAPSHTCTCPSPSILVHCTTHADMSYHTSLQDTIDRIHTLRSLVTEIQDILGKSKTCMLQVEEHMELLRDGVGHGLHVEHEALVDTLSEAIQQLTSYEKQFYQSVEIQAWTCISQDSTRKLKGAKGTIKGAVVQAC